jgi:hypothetical protein
MNAIKTILNVLGVLLSVPVALLLAAWLLLAPVINSAASWVRPDTIKQIVRSIDYDAIMEDHEDGLPQQEELKKLMKTEAVAEIMELYLEDIMAQLEGEPAGTLFYEQSVRDIIEARWDEVLPIFREMMKESSSDMNPDTMTDEELKDMLREAMDETIPEMIADMGTAEDLSINVPEVRLAVQLLRSYRLSLAVVLTAVVLSMLLFLFRIYRLRGLIWLSVVYFIVSGLTLIMSQGVRMAVTMMPAEAVARATPAMLLAPAAMELSRFFTPCLKPAHLEVLWTWAMHTGWRTMMTDSTQMARNTESSAECWRAMSS